MTLASTALLSSLDLALDVDGFTFGSLVYEGVRVLLRVLVCDEVLLLGVVVFVGALLLGVLVFDGALLLGVLVLDGALLLRVLVLDGALFLRVLVLEAALLVGVLDVDVDLFLVFRSSDVILLLRVVLVHGFTLFIRYSPMWRLWLLRRNETSFLRIKIIEHVA